jgi:protein regulator of cytokinesis 1
VRLVAAEKNDMADEAQRIITTIKQMDISINGPKDRLEYEAEDEDLKITTPLLPCLQALKEKHLQIAKIHKERFEQVKSMCTKTSAIWYANYFQNSYKLWNHTPPISRRHSSKSPSLLLPITQASPLISTSPRVM